MTDMSRSKRRRIVVGTDPQGRSVVLSDARDMAESHPGKVSIEEVWWQPQSPFRPEHGLASRVGEVGIEPPSSGAVVRLLSVPPVSVGHEWVLDLHFDDALHVITLTSGALDIILETEEVSLEVGDSIVLPGSVHDLRNLGHVPATFVYTSFPLSR